ncbi:reticulon-like protein B1 [Elaeis guineensis]|uniref:Reticulon-like protein n=1 Tax=Elaeis guineensis var. tenera TaxID=51953 RepID=A0A6I9R1N7_ELAGV|nr:reticulon-like protein B2 [Elaeis guineensis]
MSNSSSSGTHVRSSIPEKLYERLLDLLGGEKGADIVLWRKKPLSAGLLVGATVIWLLIEVVGYHFLTILCHMAIVAMLVIFAWSNGAALLQAPPPNIPGANLSPAFKVVQTFESKLNHFLSVLRGIALGEDLKLFLLTIGSLLTISVIGSYYSFPSLLYFVFLCTLTLPALYKKYKTEVDVLADKGSIELKKLVEKYRENFLTMTPRSPVKEEKGQ